MLYIGLSVFFVLLMGCKDSSDKSEYTIPYHKGGAIVVDANSADWEEISRLFTITKFTAPWHSDKVDMTTFTAFTDDNWLYFMFKVKDSDLVYTSEFAKESDVARGDRVELFFAPDTTLSNYFCIEINPKGDILDYHAAYYRRFDESWKLKNMKVATKILPSGYIVEGKIPIQFLDNLRSHAATASKVVWLGVYRANYARLDQDAEKVQWITWKSPNTANADFHIPETFNQVIIEKR